MLTMRNNAYSAYNAQQCSQYVTMHKMPYSDTMRSDAHNACNAY